MEASDDCRNLLDMTTDTMNGRDGIIAENNRTTTKKGRGTAVDRYSAHDQLLAYS